MTPPNQFCYRCLRTISYNRKCSCSSSSHPHKRLNLSLKGVFGRVNLPSSTCRGRQPALSSTMIPQMLTGFSITFSLWHTLVHILSVFLNLLHLPSIHYFPVSSNVCWEELPTILLLQGHPSINKSGVTSISRLCRLFCTQLAKLFTLSANFTLQGKSIPVYICT